MRERIRRVLPTMLLSLALALGAAASLLAASASSSPVGVGSPYGLGLPGNPGDLLAVGQGAGQAVAATPLQQPPSPRDVASAPPRCGKGSRPVPGHYPDGRVPAAVTQSPQAAAGFTCNLTFISHQGESGGFKVWRYVDHAGRVCAYYDTALLYPMNAVSTDNKPSTGVAVLDMTNPAHPVQTDTLTTPTMETPHESLSLNQPRGLLGAVAGNPFVAPGDVAFYSLAKDCRHPVLDFSGPMAPLGHEGSFSPDGRTFWATSTYTPQVTAIDVADPSDPRVLWEGQLTVHGLSFSDDGDTAYMTAPQTGNFELVDVSQIQHRDPSPQARMISQFTWTPSSIPQNAYAFTSHRHRYLLEFDEYAFSFNTRQESDHVGGARIIDIDRPSRPRVISDIRLQVNMPAAHAAASNDPGAVSSAQGYASHYCAIPREVDPQIVACSFIDSGLRVFNISDVRHPREVAYYVAPPKATLPDLEQASDFAMSKPAFDIRRREVWYTDGNSGFYVLRLAPSAWRPSAK